MNNITTKINKIKLESLKNKYIGNKYTGIFFIIKTNIVVSYTGV